MRYVIAEDFVAIREEFVKWISDHIPQLECVGQYSDGSEAIAKCDFSSIDLLLTDIQMTPTDGFVLIEKALMINPRLKTIVLSQYDEKVYRSTAKRIGARAFIIKNCNLEVFCGVITDIISNTAPAWIEMTRTTPNVLTEREVDILKLLAQGSDATRISEQLMISKRTVDRHRENIKKKLGAENTPNMIFKAMQMNLLK